MKLILYVQRIQIRIVKEKVIDLLEKGLLPRFETVVCNRNFKFKIAYSINKMNNLHCYFL
jgi:hypothetical protein